MSLSNADKKQFRSIGHQLKPVVIIAQKGLTDNIAAEVDRALREHELIKVKIIASTREDKKAISDDLCQRFSAECVQSIGHMVLLYRAAKKPDPRLSNIARHKQG